jgi:hypothetical protein
MLRKKLWLAGAMIGAMVGSAAGVGIALAEPPVDGGVAGVKCTVCDCNPNGPDGGTQCKCVTIITTSCVPRKF